MLECEKQSKIEGKIKLPDLKVFKARDSSPFRGEETMVSNEPKKGPWRGRWQTGYCAGPLYPELEDQPNLYGGTASNHPILGFKEAPRTQTARRVHYIP
jgi:hypothetical protein